MKEKVNIIISSLRGGGAERVCVTVSNSLIDNGYKVDLTVVNLYDSIFQNDLYNEVQLNNMNKKHIRSCIFELFRYMKKRKEETILVFNYEIACILVGLKIMFRLDNKIICRSINTISKEMKDRKGIKKLFSIISTKMMKHMDIIIAQSEGMKEDLIEYSNLNSSKIVVINNPVNSKISGFVTRNRLQIENNISEGQYILYMGRLAEQKGLFYLLDAYKICLNKGCNMKLKLVGKGYLKEELVKYSIKIGIRDNIEFNDFTTDIINMYINSRVVVLSSLYEGFPNVLVEAIALGKPVVAFDCPSGAKDIIQDGINGYLVKYLDVEMLSDKIIEACNGYWEKEKIMHTALRYDKKTIINKYIEVLKKINSKN